MQSKVPDFDTLERLLAVSALAPGPAEAQGVLCGLLCAGEPDARQRWLAELLPDSVPDSTAKRRCREQLDAIAARTQARIAAPDFDFEPLLPNANASLARRATALHDWSRGFLYGIALGGLELDGLAPVARETCADFIELTRMDLDAFAEDEEHEAALTELIEFVRIAVALMFETHAAAPWRR